MKRYSLQTQPNSIAYMGTDLKGRYVEYAPTLVDLAEVDVEAVAEKSSQIASCTKFSAKTWVEIVLAALKEEAQQ